MKKFKLLVILAIASGVSIAGCKKEGKKDDIVATTYTLNTTATNGTVVKNPDLTTYNSGAIVQLTATPNSDYKFSSWSGDATGSTNPLPVTMYANKNITANFTVLVVNVKSTGATGNGSTDDTEAIQAAVNQVAGTGGTVLVPAGTYRVTAGGAWPYPAINLGSNMTFKMDAGAVIKLTPNAYNVYVVLYIATKTNVNVVGGTLQGERHQHLTPGDDAWTTPKDANCPDVGNCWGQWGYGMWVDAQSSNVYIDGVTSREMWGDGFCIGGAGGGVNLNVNFNNVVADDNRRQGMSICEADGVVVKNSSFINTGGHAPCGGIDVEPLGDNQWVKNVQIINCQFNNNNSTGLILSGPSAIMTNITVTGNTMTNNAFGGIYAWGFEAGMVVTDNTISGTGTSDGIGISGYNGGQSTGGVFSNNHITHTGSLYRPDQAGIAVYDGATGNTIQNNDVHGNYSQAVIDNVGGNTISGNTIK